jgi:hypothetical protein
MLTPAQLSNLDAVSEDERILKASHLEACGQLDGFRETVGIQRERIAELERALLGQSMRIATHTDV